MGTIKTNTSFTIRHKSLLDKTTSALKKVTKHLIAETKATNSYIVVSDKNGKIKKIPAKDL
jgi:hypothetical protein